MAITITLLDDLLAEITRFGERATSVRKALRSDPELSKQIALGLNVRGKADVAGLKRSSLEVSRLLVQLREKQRA